MTSAGLIVSRIENPFLWLVGSGRSRYGLSSWVFLRALGLTYVIAFVSLWVQISGLIGPNGIAPARELLGAVRRYYPGIKSFNLVPTVLWVGAGAGALHLVCALGVVASLLIVVDITPTVYVGEAWGV